MNTWTILAFTLGTGNGLLAGYGLGYGKRWIEDCRQMVYQFCASLRRSA